MTIFLLGFAEYSDEDAFPGPGEENIFTSPPPPPCLPDADHWPPRQSGLTIYVRPKAVVGPRVAPMSDVDDFLSTIQITGTLASSEDALSQGSSHITAEAVRASDSLPEKGQQDSSRMSSTSPSPSAGLVSLPLNASPGNGRPPSVEEETAGEVKDDSESEGEGEGEVETPLDPLRALDPDTRGMCRLYRSWFNLC